MSTLLRRAVIAGAVALVPLTAAVVLSWPAHASGSFPTAYAAPYLEVHSTDVGDLATDQGATGLKYYTLAFLIPSSGCTAKWEYDGDPVGAFNSQISSRLRPASRSSRRDDLIWLT